MRPLFTARGPVQGARLCPLSDLARTIMGMPPTSDPRGSARSADALNEEIRALWQRAGGTLSPEQRREYEVLVTEWAAAVRAEAARPGIVEAA